MSDKPYGSLTNGLEKLNRMPKELQQVITGSPIHLNLNQVWDFYQRHGIDRTKREIEREIREQMQPRQRSDESLLFECGHKHATFEEAQYCPQWRQRASNTL